MTQLYDDTYRATMWPGLGLAISRTIAERHGTWIAVASAGEG